jgi:hypothetical protein
MIARSTLKDLGRLATEEVGFCRGIYWRSVTGSRVAEGQISPNYRLAYVLFSGFAPARRFRALLARRGVEQLSSRSVRLLSVEHGGVRLRGVAVVAVVSPDRDHATGLRRAPACDQQPGYHRFFADQARRSTSQRPWWDAELGDSLVDGERFDRHELAPGRDYAERQADEALERELDLLEAEFDEKLWWYGDTRRRSRYAPKLGSVRELFAYARKGELSVEEFARRNREQQAERWLAEQREQDRQRQHELDRDQAEIAAAVNTPRRGHKHADDQDWLATQGTLKGRRGLKQLYRDVEPRPRRPVEA